VRAAEARAATLKRELEKMGGSASPLQAPTQDTTRNGGPSGPGHPESYIPLRQVPRLAVPYANLYREVRVQEAVYDLLTQQDEVARIQEAKDVPAVNIIDAPGVPEKKSFPPRALLTLAFTLVSFLAFSVFLVFRDHWRSIQADDPRKVFAAEVMQGTLGKARRAIRFNRRAE
jgi:capsule polysaccharide export protein KpsE/RkpR